MKASNPQTAAHSVNGKTYLASMGTELRLVYFWKMTTLEGEERRNEPVNSAADLHPDAFWVNFSPHLREQIHQFALDVDGLKRKLPTRAVKKSRCDVLHRVFNNFKAVFLWTEHYRHTNLNR